MTTYKVNHACLHDTSFFQLNRGSWVQFWAWKMHWWRDHFDTDL